MTELVVKFGVFRDAHDRWGTTSSVPWPRLAASLAQHKVGTKDGHAITCATFDGPRGNNTLQERTMIALDVEASAETGEVPPDPRVIEALLRAKRLAAVMWTTHSHTEQDPRYRVLLPLSTPVSARNTDVDPYMAGVVAAQLNLIGVCDRGKFGAASLFYTPRHNEGSPYWSTIIEGEPVGSSDLLAVATMASEKVAMDEAERLALRRNVELPPETLARLEAFNDAHPLPMMLEKYGYQRSRARWKSRYQHGQGATTILPDGKVWVSFSMSDADAGVGNRPAKRTSQCACWGDSFALYCHYEHGGSFRAALASLPPAPQQDAAE